MTVLKVTKMEAARRQLHTATELWLAGGDPVSIQTLAAAARTLIDDVAKHRKVKRFDQRELAQLLSVTPEQAHGLFTHAANYFKHADRDPESEGHFNVNSNTAMLAACFLSLLRMGEVNFSETEIAFATRIAASLPTDQRP